MRQGIGIAVLGVLLIFIMLFWSSSHASQLTESELSKVIRVELSIEKRDVLLQVPSISEEIKSSLTLVREDQPHVIMTARQLHALMFLIMAEIADIEAGTQYPVDGAGNASGLAIPPNASLQEILRKLDEQAIEASLPLDLNPKMVQIEQAMAKALSEMGARPKRIVIDLTDMQGTQIDNVLLEITLARPGLIPFGKPMSEMQEIRVTTQHTINTGNSWSLSVEAFKEGYYRESVDLNLQERSYLDEFEQRLWADALKGRSTEQPLTSLRQRNITLRLQKHGNPIHLQAFAGRLTFNKDGESTVTSLDFDEDYSVKLRIPSEKCTREISVDPDGVLDLGLDVVSIHAALNDEGLLADLVAVGVRQSSMQFPRELILKMHDPNGGFILHDPRRAREFTGRRYVMLEAPEEGYASELRLTAEQLSQGVDFFLLNQGHYGKGRLAHMRISRNRAAIQESDFSVWLNRTPGDRNLENAKDANDRLNYFH